MKPHTEEFSPSTCLSIPHRLNCSVQCPSHQKLDILFLLRGKKNIYIKYELHLKFRNYIIIFSLLNNAKEQLFIRIFFRTNFNAQSPLSTGVVCSRLVERGYQMLCLYSCSSWRWACQGQKHVEDNVTYMFILKCALKLVLKNILYYDARSEKHQIIQN